MQKKLQKLLGAVMALALGLAAILAAQEIVDVLNARRKQAEVQALYPAAGAWLRGLIPAARAEAFSELEEDFEDFWDVFTEEGFVPPVEATPEPLAEEEWAWFDGLEATPGEALPEVQPDFAELYETNPDVVGWLTVDQLSQPVIYRDNDFYLDHDFYGKHDLSGTLFLNLANTVYPRDRVLFIHGHAMQGHAMFGDLRRFKDENYVRQHPVITFRSIYDEEPATYLPVAGFDASMLEGDRWYFDLLNAGYDDDDAYLAYLETIKARSYWQTPLPLTEEDELIALVTCSYIQTNGRFVLFCRRVRADEDVNERIGLVTGLRQATP